MGWRLRVFETSRQVTSAHYVSTYAPQDQSIDLMIVSWHGLRLFASWARTIISDNVHYACHLRGINDHHGMEKTKTVCSIVKFSS